jgi:hypothetical protein
MAIAAFFAGTTAVAEDIQPAGVVTAEEGHTVLQVQQNPAPVVGPAPMDPYQAQLAIEQARAAQIQARLAERQARNEERLRIKEESRRSGRPLILSGAITLGVGYAISAVVGGMLLDVGEEKAGYMFIPIVGNPIYLGFLLDDLHNDMNDSGDDAPEFMLSMALLTPALAQLTGAILLTFGLVKHSRYVKEKRNIALVPTMAPNAGGLSFSMTF